MVNGSQFPTNRGVTRVAMVRLACGAVLLGLVFWVWYCWAADYGYAAVAGTYVFGDDGQQSTLILLDNRVFEQERRLSGTVERIHGTWRRVGEGGVVLSKEFLKVPGQKVRADGQADGRIEKSFGGFFMSVVFEGDERGPIFRKRAFR
jgi:hypothetical protein